MNTLHATPTHNKIYNSDKELVQDWLNGIEFDAGDYTFTIKDSELLANTYNYDDICIKHENSEICSALFIPLFKFDNTEKFKQYCIDNDSFTYFAHVKQ